MLDTSHCYGSHLLFHNLANNSGLLDTLRKAFSNIFREIFVLACFLVETCELLAYEEGLSQADLLPLTPRLSSQRISDLLAYLFPSTSGTAFMKVERERTPEDQYVELDIASIPSYSQIIQGCECGYNRDHEVLPRLISACSLRDCSCASLSKQPSFMAA